MSRKTNDQLYLELLEEHFNLGQDLASPPTYDDGKTTFEAWNAAHRQRNLRAKAVVHLILAYQSGEDIVKAKLAYDPEPEPEPIHPFKFTNQAATIIAQQITAINVIGQHLSIASSAMAQSQSISASPTQSKGRVQK